MTDERLGRGGLPLDEFRCQHWGHEVGIINDQQCQRFSKDGERFCGYHLVDVRKRREAVALLPKIDPEVLARLIADLGGA